MFSLAHAMSLRVEKMGSTRNPGAQAMVMNPVQFQAGLSVSAFFDLYGTEPHCEAVPS